MLLSVRADLTYDFPEACETLLMVEAARGPDQTVRDEALRLSPELPLTRIDDPSGPERRVAVLAEGRVSIGYAATVEVVRGPVVLTGLPQPSVRSLPPHVLRYLRPSRYCPSDRFERFVHREFGRWRGGDRAAAILDWIVEHVDYVAGVSDAATDAGDTFSDRAGVCRDFAHLAITLCRAGDLPARAVSAYAWRLDPPDMHAVIEVFLDGAWRLADPTRKAPEAGLVRVAQGRDAADIAFMSVFGEADLVAQSFAVSAA